MAGPRGSGCEAGEKFDGSGEGKDAGEQCESVGCRVAAGQGKEVVATRECYKRFGTVAERCRE